MSQRLLKNKDVIAQRVQDETVLFDMTSGNYYSLNELGSKAWDLIDQSGSLAEIATHLAAEYDAPPEVIAQDLHALFDQLQQDGLVIEVKGEGGSDS